MSAALTREQKLMAELLVQLGNIAEAIRVASSGEDVEELHATIEEQKQQLATAATAQSQLQKQIGTLQQSIAQEKAQLQTQIATLQQANADLHNQLASADDGDITPDNITEVMSHLGIDHT